MKTGNNIAEEIRLRYLYRDLIIRGKARISFDSSRKLVGPDCSYRLYSLPEIKKKDMQ